MEVKCPTCNKIISWSKKFEFKPFCCERCRLIDLGQWASEQHRIPGTRLEAAPGNNSDQTASADRSDKNLH